MKQPLKIYTLDEKLKVLMEMESKSLTRREMARLTGISQGTIATWIKNKDEIKIQAKVDIDEKQLPAMLNTPTKAKTKREELENQLDYIDKVFALIINPQLDKLAKKLNKEIELPNLIPPQDPVTLASVAKEVTKGVAEAFTSYDAERLGNLMDRLQKSKIEIIESLEIIYAAEDSHKIKVVDSAAALNRRRDQQRFYESCLIEMEQKRLAKEALDAEQALAITDAAPIAEIVQNSETPKEEPKQ
jgi:transcriptional regulator with XRE-family HTH domain